MKKTVITIIAIVVALMLTFTIYYLASNNNVLKDNERSNTSTTTSSDYKDDEKTTTKATTTSTTKRPNINVNSLLKNVKREKGKVNIYFFYGDGCPRCELEHKAFKEIKSKYGKYYNLYEFEIWYDKTNNILAHIFAENMNFDLTGVPFTVIGRKYIDGFGTNSKEELIRTIESEKDSGYDLYFDVIKKQQNN